VLLIDDSEKRNRAREEKTRPNENFVRRSKATVINLFTFLCNRKIRRKKIPLDAAGLTAMECDVTSTHS
jgi:hypothetical protein